MVSIVATRNDKVYIEIMTEDETLCLSCFIRTYSIYDMHLFHGPDAFPLRSLSIHPSTSQKTVSILSLEPPDSFKSTLTSRAPHLLVSEGSRLSIH